MLEHTDVAREEVQGDFQASRREGAAPSGHQPVLSPMFPQYFSQYFLDIS